MNRILHSIRAVFPRRRRLWRYVSPRRRRLGLVLLAVFIACTYAYWSLTNDQRIARQARRYLQLLTGGRVEIASVDFSLTEGLDLRGVRLFVPGDTSGEPFLRAKTVILRHKPWDLLFKSKLQCSEVICIAPEVTLTHDAQADTYNFQRLLFFSSHQRTDPRFELGWTLPPIRVRQGRLRWVDVDHGLRLPFEEMPITLSMVPGAEGQYIISFEEQHEGSDPVISGRIAVDMRTGKAKLLSGVAPIPNLDRALPGKYRQWRRRYQISGEVHITGPLDSAAGTGAMACEFADVSLVLPADQGGLELTGVSGKATFDDAGVTLEDIAGQIAGTGGGSFKLSGRYEGYKPDSPYELTVQVTSMQLPLAVAPNGAFAEVTDMLASTCELSGRCDMSAELGRDSAGAIHSHVLVAPQGMSAQCKYFPYRLDDLRGTAEISAGQVELRNITAARDGATVTVNGAVELPASRGNALITVSASDLRLDEELRAALPVSVRHMWDEVRPAGRVNVSADVRCSGGEVESVEAVAEMTGKTSAAYKHFPYPVDNLVGKVVFREGDVALQQIRGSRGLMRCLIDGTIRRVRDGGPADIDVEVRRLPLDGELLAAMGQASRRMLASLHPAGWADRVTCKLHRPDGGKMRYAIDATVSEASFKPDAFPCEVTNATGKVRIADGLVNIEQIEGDLSEGKASVTGRIDLNGAEAALPRARGDGADLDRQAAETSGRVAPAEGRTAGELSVKATNLSISKELLAAMPAGTGSPGAHFAEGGKCDLDIDYIRWTPGPSATSQPAAATATTAPAAQRRWAIAGNARLREAALQLAGDRVGVSGSLVGLIERDEAGTAFNARVALDTVDVGPHRLGDFQARGSKAAGSSFVKIDDLSANVYGGKAGGQVEIDLSDPPRYGICLSVENVDLKRLFAAGAKKGDEKGGMRIQGLLKGNLRMTATAGRVETRQASGVLKITKARFTHLPVVLDLANVIYLWLPGNTTYAEGEATYRIEGEDLIFEEIFLRGLASSMLGSGRVDLSDDSLHLVFLTGPPGRLPRLAGIEDLLTGIAREIAEIRVTGTIARPVPTTVSLPSLDDAIRRLLSPQAERSSK